MHQPQYVYAALVVIPLALKELRRHTSTTCTSQPVVMVLVLT